MTAASFVAGVPGGVGDATYDAEFVGTPALEAREHGTADGVDDAIVATVPVHAYRTGFYRPWGHLQVMDADDEARAATSFAFADRQFIEAGSTADIEVWAPAAAVGTIASDETVNVYLELVREDSWQVVDEISHTVPAGTLATASFPPQYMEVRQASFSEQAVEEDGEEISDRILLEFDVATSRPGIAVFALKVGYDDGTSSEWFETQDFEFSSQWARLAEGTSVLQLRLPAGWMASTGHTGPWTVVIGSFFSPSGHDADFAWMGNTTYETQAYDPADFAPPAIALSVDPEPVLPDEDADEKYDSLIVPFAAEGDVATPARITAQVHDADGAPISRSSRLAFSPDETGEHLGEFHFDARDLHESGFTGSLEVDVQVWEETPDGAVPVNQATVRVDGLSFDDFDPPDVVLDGPPAAVFGDSDGVTGYESLGGTIPVHVNHASSTDLLVSVVSATDQRVLIERRVLPGMLEEDDQFVNFDIPVTGLPGAAGGWTGGELELEVRTHPDAPKASVNLGPFTPSEFQPSPVTYDGTVTETLFDSDNPADSPADELVLSRLVDVDAPGTFHHEATLFGRTGSATTPTESIRRHVTTTYEEAGTFPLEFRFPGRVLYNLADTEPFRVVWQTWSDDASFHDALVAYPLAYATDPTQAYEPADFEPAPLHITEPLDVTTIDDDSNEAFDRVHVEAPVEAAETVEHGWAYAVLGWGGPDDGGPHEIAGQFQDVDMAAGAAVLTFDFDGRYVHAAGGDREYWVRVELGGPDDGVPHVHSQAVGPYDATHFEAPQADAAEPDDAPTQARTLATGSSLSGNLFPFPDPDWASFHADAEATYLIKAVMRRSNSGGASLDVYDSDGRWAAPVDHGFGRVLFSTPDEGTYFVRLVAWDPESLDVDTTYELSLVEDAEATWWFNQVPEADFRTEPVVAIPEETISFFDESIDVDGQIASWHWDFGDGSTSTEAEPTHAYSDEGTYLVKLEATDDEGRTDTRFRDVPVTSHVAVVDVIAEPVDPFTVNVTYEAVARGDIDDARSWVFYSEDGATATLTDPVNGLGVQTLTLSDLTPATEYEIGVEVEPVTGDGPRLASTPLTIATPAEPVLSTPAAVNETPVGAEIEYNITADTEDWESFVRYGLSAGSLVNATEPAAGIGNRSVLVDGLEGDTTYHFQVVVQMGEYLLESAVDSFETLPVPPAPTLTIDPVDTFTATTAHVEWTLTGGGPDARSRLVYNHSRDATNQTSDWHSGAGAHETNLTGLAPNATHRIWVEAEQPYGPGAETNHRTFTTPLLPPMEPTTPAVANVSATTANISWSVGDSDHALNHRVFVKPQGGPAAPRDAGAGSGDLTYHLSGLAPNTTHSVWVNVTGEHRVANHSAQATFKTTRLVLPSVPNLTVQATPDGAHLTWDRPDAQDLAGYLVWRSQSPYRLIHNTTNATHTEYTDTDVNASADALYVVTYFRTSEAGFLDPASLDPEGSQDSAVAVSAGALQAAREAPGSLWGASWVWILGTAMVVVLVGLAGILRWKRRSAPAREDTPEFTGRVAWQAKQETTQSPIRDEPATASVSDWSSPPATPSAASQTFTDVHWDEEADDVHSDESWAVPEMDADQDFGDSLRPSEGAGVGADETVRQSPEDQRRHELQTILENRLARLESLEAIIASQSR